MQICFPTLIARIYSQEQLLAHFFETITGQTFAYFYHFVTKIYFFLGIGGGTTRSFVQVRQNTNQCSFYTNPFL